MTQPWQGRVDAPRQESPAASIPLRDVRLVDVDVPFERVFLLVFKVWAATALLGLLVALIGGLLYGLVTVASR